MNNKHLLLEDNHFKDVMIEAKGLIEKAMRYKYNLMHAEGLKGYELWAPYILSNLPSEIRNAPGYKVAFMQVMSIVVALHGEKEELKEKEMHPQGSNIIPFPAYKTARNDECIYFT